MQWRMLSGAYSSSCLKIPVGITLQAAMANFLSSSLHCLAKVATKHAAMYIEDTLLYQRCPLQIGWQYITATMAPNMSAFY